MKTYKAFNKDLTCHGYQYEIGKKYEIEGDVQMCSNGFHACESPLEIFDHYDMIGSRFCEVEQGGDIKKEEGTTKICSSKIKIVAELKLADIIKLGVEWLVEKTKPTLIDKFKDNNDNGGYFAQIGSSGDSAKIGSSGDSAKIGSSGDYAQIGSSGYYAKIGSSGYSAQIGSSGYSAKIGSSGDNAKIDSTGEDSVISCAGNKSVVKAKVGSWVTLAEWVYSEDKKRYIPKCVKTEYVDGERIKADTWYMLKDGEFKQVNVMDI